MSLKKTPLLPIASCALACAPTLLGQAKASSSPTQSETLLKSTESWDGHPYESFPAGKPELTVLKITIPAHKALDWHHHLIPNAGYILSGKITVERKEDGKKQEYSAGQVIPETVGITHRGIAGDEPVVLIVFYAGTPGVPLAVKDK